MPRKNKIKPIVDVILCHKDGSVFKTNITHTDELENAGVVEFRNKFYVRGSTMGVVPAGKYFFYETTKMRIG